MSQAVRTSVCRAGPLPTQTLSSAPKHSHKKHKHKKERHERPSTDLDKLRRERKRREEAEKVKAEALMLQYYGLPKDKDASGTGSESAPSRK